MREVPLYRDLRLDIFRAAAGCSGRPNCEDRVWVEPPNRVELMDLGGLVQHPFLT